MKTLEAKEMESTEDDDPNNIGARRLDDTSTHNSSTNSSLRKKLPPIEFTRWLADNYPQLLTKAQWETVNALYTSSSFREAGRKSGRHKNVAKKAFEKLITAFEEYKDLWERGGKETSNSSVTKHPKNEPVLRRVPSTGGISSKIPSKGTTATAMRYSSTTTTFREVDKAIAGVLSEHVSGVLAEEEVYIKVGKIALYNLLRHGLVEPSKVIELENNPEGLLKYIASALNSLDYRFTHEEIRKLRHENMKLKAELNRIIQQFESYKRNCEEGLQYLSKILTESQKEKLANFVLLQELVHSLFDER